MQITLKDQPATLKTDISSAQLRFNKLWQQVERKQKQNTKFKQELESLMETYRKQVLPVEMALQRAQVTEVERLTTLFGRKSLGKHHRHELAEWIGNNLDDLAQHECEDVPRLVKQFNAALAAFHGISQEELDAEEAARLDLEASLTELFDEFDHGSESVECDEASFEEELSDVQDDMFGTGEEEPFGFSADEPEFGNNPPRADQLLSGKWIRRLFRRTAQVLHPDKEQDPKQRAHKELLMSQLLEARDKQDVMTMLQLHTEHVDDGQMQVAAEEMQALCELLEQQKDRLDADKDDFIYETPFRHAVYEALYAASQKTRDKKLRNLSRLKEVLDVRYNEAIIGW